MSEQDVKECVEKVAKHLMAIINNRDEEKSGRLVEAHLNSMNVENANLTMALAVRCKELETVLGKLIAWLPHELGQEAQAMLLNELHKK